MKIVGILLAAGHSRRFGLENKLLQKLPDGAMMALSSAKNMLEALPHSVGIVRADNPELEAALVEQGMKVGLCSEDEQEMAASLSRGISHAMLSYPHSRGFVVALGDMPYIRPQTITEVAKRLDSGAGIVVPIYQGKRGHPVGFSARFSEELLSLTGDQGARSVFEKYPSELEFFECDDSGILIDIDTLADLMKTGPV